MWIQREVKDMLFKKKKRSNLQIKLLKDLEGRGDIKSKLSLERKRNTSYSERKRSSIRMDIHFTSSEVVETEDKTGNLKIHN